MSFEDAARRMRGSRGSGAGGSPTTGRDPDEIIAEAQIAARRAARIRNLVLGSILLVGGLVVAVLWLAVHADARTTTDPRNTGHAEDLALLDYLGVAAIGAIGTGVHQILRGIGILKLQ
jgi:hypothetical protein